MTKYILALALGVITTSVAAPMESAANREILALRRNHEDGLNRLLNKFLKERNLAAVSAICAEMKVIRSEVPKIESGKSPIGLWNWHENNPVILRSNGLAIWKDSNYGIWRWLNESERKVEIQWDNGYSDILTISADGKKLYIVNNYNDKFTADKAEVLNQ